MCDRADEALQDIKLVVLKTFLPRSALKYVVHAVQRWRDFICTRKFQKSETAGWEREGGGNRRDEGGGGGGGGGWVLDERGAMLAG